MLGKCIGENMPSRKSEMVTSQDVATRAGVSIMTVSNVINCKGRVSVETRMRVLSAIRALGYRPNAAARSLAGGEPVKIAMLYRDMDSVFIRSMVASASTAATAAGVQLVLSEPDDASNERISACIENLVENGSRALLLMPPFAERLSGSAVVQSAGVPMLALVTGCAFPDMPTLRIDNHAAALTLTTVLLDAGHRRIGVIAGPRTHSDSLSRVAGHEAALREYGIASDQELVVEGAFTFASGIDAADTLLALPDPPTAIVAANDDMAAGVLWAAHRRGLLMPQDLAVTGFDDSLVASRVWPALTTIRQPIDAMTTRAIEMLLESLASPEPQSPATVRDELFGFALIERASTKAEKALVI
jgi:LacI family transcriptional regulator